jgi:large subunit ribosomal protein L29
VKKQDFRSLSTEELISKEKALRDEIFKLNQQRYTGNVQKPHMFALVRKDIARIQTILNEKKEK